MSDVQCPYCEKYQEVCHDDGQGYEEGLDHEMSCVDCDREFTFETSISYDYEAKKIPCTGDHNLVLDSFDESLVIEHVQFTCTNCSFERFLTDSEREKYATDYFIEKGKYLQTYDQYKATRSARGNPFRGLS